MIFWQKYKRSILGIAIGALGGYLYYAFIGCASGTCPITSHPLHSSLYGALMGGLLFNSFSSANKNSVNDKNTNE